MIAATL